MVGHSWAAKQRGQAAQGSLPLEFGSNFAPWGVWCNTHPALVCTFAILLHHPAATPAICLRFLTHLSTLSALRFIINEQEGALV